MSMHVCENTLTQYNKFVKNVSLNFKPIKLNHLNFLAMILQIVNFHIFSINGFSFINYDFAPFNKVFFLIKYTERVFIIFIICKSK